MLVEGWNIGWEDWFGKEKNGDDWYVGGVTDKNARNYVVKCDFLDPGATYEAALYMDGVTAHYDNNPESYIITRFNLTDKDSVPVKMAPGGGFALSIKKKNKFQKYERI